MSTEQTAQDPLIEAVIQNPAKDKAEHAHEVAHAFDSPEEVAHAKEHAIVNIRWFAGFFFLVLCAVANYEFNGTTNLYAIFALAAARCLLIAFFMNWLFHSFSLIFRTFLFSAIFLAGMVFLSWWDSTLPHIGDPIKDRITPPVIASHVP